MRYIDAIYRCEYTDGERKCNDGGTVDGAAAIAPPRRARSRAGAIGGAPRYTAAVRRHTDYALARRAVLRELQRGRLGRLDVCDAHPELVRAARNVGEPAPHPCPVCGGGDVAYVSYVYGDGLRAANGRCLSHPGELEKLGKAHDEFTRYLVEVCPDCRWNHLARRELHGRRHEERAPRRRLRSGANG
jgi:hypothetical protein